MKKQINVSVFASHQELKYFYEEDFSQVFFALVFLSAVAAQLEKKKSTNTINSKVTKPLILTKNIAASSEEMERQEKSLINFFPFNIQEHKEHGNLVIMVIMRTLLMKLLEITTGGLLTTKTSLY